MAALTKTTHVYATHEIPLECDVYSAADYPRDTPALLFFHSGGLTGGSRIQVPAWLVQTCFQRKWPLVSVSYRLLPQAGGKGLLEDAKAAYEFAESLGGGPQRKVIATGASAGCLLPTLIAHHLEPKPIALLYITGIPTFQHPFFNSSTLLPPTPIKEHEVEPIFSEPASVGASPYPPTVFYLDCLLPSGSKNPSFARPKEAPAEFVHGNPNRVVLYDYYLYENMYVPLVGDVDPGFEWAKTEAGRAKLATWPTTILIQGDRDDDVKIDVCSHVAECLGSKAKFCLSKGQEHLFEAGSFIEDEGPGMDTVRQAVGKLDDAVSKAMAK